MLLLKSFKKYFKIIIVLLLATPLLAAGSPVNNPLYNPLAILLVCIMIVLLIAIAILGTVLTGAADVSLKKWKKKKEPGKKSLIGQAAALFIGCMMLTPAVFAQDAQYNKNMQPAATIGGLSATTFYVMSGVIFMELLIVLVLLINIRLLARTQRQKLMVQELQPVPIRNQENCMVESL